MYRKWLGKQPTYMRQVHKSAEKAFVDYSGDKVKVVDTDTGEVREVEIFVVHVTLKRLIDQAFILFKV